jgi:hypothetical protein
MASKIRILQPGDDQFLMNVAAEVFDNPIDAELTREFLEDPRHHIAVAIDDEQVVGFASGVHYIHPDKPPELWINEVGVAPAWIGQSTSGSTVRGWQSEKMHRCVGTYRAWQRRRHCTVFVYRRNRRKRRRFGNQ